MSATVNLVINGQYNAGKVFDAIGKDLGEASRAVSSFTASAHGSFNGMLTGLADIQAGFSMVIGTAQQIGQAFEQAMAASMAYIDQVDSLQDVTGASAEQASRLILVTQQLGVSAEQVTKAMQQAALRGIQPNTESLGKLADQYVKIQDPVERARFLTQNFGETGAKLAPLLDKGKAGIEEMIGAAEEYGHVLTEVEKLQAEQLQRAQAQNEQAKNSWVITTLPAWTAAVTGFTALLNDATTTNENLIDNFTSGTPALKLLDLLFTGGAAAIDAFNKNAKETEAALAEIKKQAQEANNELGKFQAYGGSVPVVGHGQSYKAGQGPAYPWSESNPTGWTWGENGQQVYPGRATGGPVVGGMTYLVGERGPEPFTPSTSGFVGGAPAVSSPVTMNNNFNFYGTPQENAAAVEQKIREMKRNGQI